jgi:hypothetical protein
MRRKMGSMYDMYFEVMGAHRMDSREELDKVICDFLDRGGPVEGLDVALSQQGVVDLDLLVACLNEMKHRMADSALKDMRETTPLEFHDDGAPLQIVA